MNEEVAAAAAAASAAAAVERRPPRAGGRKEGRKEGRKGFHQSRSSSRNRDAAGRGRQLGATCLGRSDENGDRSGFDWGRRHSAWHCVLRRRRRHSPMGGERVSRLIGGGKQEKAPEEGNTNVLIGVKGVSCVRATQNLH